MGQGCSYHRCQSRAMYHATPYEQMRAPVDSFETMCTVRLHTYCQPHFTEVMTRYRNMLDPMRSLSGRLRGVMAIAKMTVHSLAFESGVSEKYITELRNGHKTNPTIDVIESFAKVLQVQPAWLAWGKGKIT